MNDFNSRLRSPSPAERDIRLAIKQTLEGEALTLNWLLRTVRRLNVKTLRKLTESASRPAASMDWWHNANRVLPPSLHFIRQMMSRGLPPPVFCTLSLSLLGLAPSLRVLVPYHAARSGPSGFSDTFWLNPPAHVDVGGSLSSWRSAARTLSHAILNLAYSVRLADNPLLGFLALAHNQCIPIYIPDVSAAPQSGPATSAATAEEPFLGMASVLYLPLRHSDLPLLRALGAQAVLMLWSPAPGQWDHLDSRPFQPGVVEITEPSLGPDILSHDFARWLRAILLKDNESQTVINTQFIGLFRGIIRHAEQNFGSEGARDFLNKFGHGAAAAVRLYLRQEHVGPHPPLSSWIEEQFAPPLGILSILAREWSRSPTALESLAQAVCTLDYRSHRTSVRRETVRTLLSEPDAVLSAIDPALILRIPGPIAAATLKDAVTDLASEGAALHALGIDVSEKYCGLSFCFEPSREARRRLCGSAHGFERYFGTRRGLVVDPVGPGSYGIGLSLHTRFAAAWGMYRRLYVSPDGGTWRVDLAVPIERSIARPR